ncbi:hypothetical protein SEVIR_7G256533v4 [Setaria viridis]
MFFVPILCRRPSDREQFDLHLYNSEARKWCTKMMRSPSQEDFDFSYTSKAITIGGELGSVGWVDLWHGILIYDVLLDNNYFRYIPLKRLDGNPMLIRDIIIVNGYIKFFDMHTYMKLANSGYAYYILDGWDDDYKMSISKVSSKDTGCAQMLPNPTNAAVLPPNLNESEDTEPSLMSCSELELARQRCCSHHVRDPTIVVKPPEIDRD